MDKKYVEEMRKVFEQVLEHPKACELMYKALNKEVVSSEDADQWITPEGAANIIFPLVSSFQGIIEEEAQYNFENRGFGDIFEVNQADSREDFVALSKTTLDCDETYIQIMKG